MRLPRLTMVFLLAAMPALAQPTPPPPEDLGPPPGAATPPPPPASTQGQSQPRRMTMRQRFALANVTGDGKLTRDQAEAARWMPVARHFDDIDRDRKGYITLQDLRDWAAARRAARQGAAPPPQ